MKTSLTLFNTIIILIAFSALSIPQNIKQKTKTVPLTPQHLQAPDAHQQQALTPEHLLALAHQSHEPSVLPVTLKSTIDDYYTTTDFGSESHYMRSYTTYEDTNIIKACDIYLNYSLHNYYSTYLYDSQKRISKIIILNSGTYTYTYNANNKVSQVVSILENGTPNDRSAYSYDINNYLTGITHENWTGSAWQNYSRYTYTNNNSGKALVQLYQTWDAANSLWVNTFNDTYQYDNNSLLIVRIMQVWLDHWEDIMRYTYSYNANLLDTVLTENIPAGLWKPYYEDVYSYNPDNTTSHSEHFYWNNVAWTKTSYHNFSYPSGNLLRLVTNTANYNYIPGFAIPVQWIGSGVSSVKVKFSSDNGNSWIVSAASVPDTGNYTSYIPTPSTEYNYCKIRIEDAADPNTYDQSTGNFTLLFVYDTLTHNTGKVKMTVFNNGTIGSNSSIGQGFSFLNSPNALYSGGLFFGNSSKGAAGIIPSFGIKDLSMSIPMHAFTSNSNYNTISTAWYSDSIAGAPYNLSVKEQTYGKNNNPYIIYIYNLQNKSPNDLAWFYIGTFADWDIGSASSDLGGYSTAKRMAYQFDNSGTDPNYYGIVSLSGLSGASVTQAGGTRFDILNNITKVSTAPITTPGDYRMFIGSGPYNITSGSSVKVAFAFVAGTSLADLEANAALAITEWNFGAMGVNDKQPGIPQKYSLEQNYPNPFNPSTIIKYQLPKSGNISLKIYDILGSEVAALINEYKTAGYYSINFNASALPSGIYFYKLESGQFTQVKKMILMK